MMAPWIFGVTGVEPSDTETPGEEFEFKFGAVTVAVSKNADGLWSWGAAYTRADGRTHELLEYNRASTEPQMAAEDAMLSLLHLVRSLEFVG